MIGSSKVGRRHNFFSRDKIKKVPPEREKKKKIKLYKEMRK